MERIFRRQKLWPTDFRPKFSLKCCLQTFSGVDNINLIQLPYNLSIHITVKSTSHHTQIKNKKTVLQRTLNNVLNLKSFMMSTLFYTLFKTCCKVL